MPEAATVKKVTKRHLKWENPKYKARVYSGSYETLVMKKGAVKERSFVLSTVLKNKKTHAVSFDSHEAAKKAGWSKV